MRDTGFGESGVKQIDDAVGVAVERVVDGVVGLPQRGQARRDRHRVPRQGAGLIHRPERGQLLHHVAAPTECGRRQASAHHLAEGVQVGRDPFQPVPAGWVDRNPVITSSLISSAPASEVMCRSASL